MENLFIAYFPYLSLKDVPEIDFGFAKVWNFDLKKNDYINSPELLAKIEKIININVELWSGSVRDIGIISIGDINFRKYNEDENEIIRQIRHILFISFIAKNNTSRINGNSFSMATAENFDVIYQNFSVDGENFSEQTGEIIRINAGGYNFSNTKFQKPRYIHKPFRFELDQGIFNGILKLRLDKRRVFSRVLNSIQIFMEGYYNTPYLSKSARLLLHTSAFEILLSLPDSGQRKEFKEKIKKLTAFDEDQEYFYWTKIRGKSKSLKGTIKEIWADKFYSLRNNIIHGNNPDINEFIFKKFQYHLDISTLFFVLLLKKQIEKSLGVGYECDYEIKWDKWPDELIPEKEIQGFVYSMSTRRAFQRMLKKYKLI